MGQAKEAMELEGRSFLQRVRNAAEGVFEETVVVARESSPADIGRVIYDHPHRDPAPIFGVRRALQDSMELAEGRIWVVAVDYPLMTSELLRFLRDQFAAPNVELAVPVVASNPHMLCAGYSTSVLPLIEEKIGSGQYALRGLLDSCTARVISEHEIAASFDPIALTNVNTPDQYDELRRRYAQADAHR